MKFVIYFTEDDTQLSLLADSHIVHLTLKRKSSAADCNFHVLDVQQTQKHISQRLLEWVIN